jgi:hypothetical protein
VKPRSFYLFLLIMLLLAGPHLVVGASDEAPIVGCTMPNFGCNDPTGPTDTETSTCTLVSGTLNGTELDADDPALSVEPGEAVSGTVTVETYNAGSSSDTAPLAATTSWGDHETSHWGVSADIPTGAASFDVEISTTAPTDEGTYYLYFTWYWEKTYDNVMSLTNWQHSGGDVWDDDVDVADWDDFQAQQGIDNGWVETWYLDDTGEYVQDVVYPGTTVRVVVESR